MERRSPALAHAPPSAPAVTQCLPPSPTRPNPHRRGPPCPPGSLTHRRWTRLHHRAAPHRHALPSHVLLLLGQHPVSSPPSCSRVTCPRRSRHRRQARRTRQPMGPAQATGRHRPRPPQASRRASSTTCGSSHATRIHGPPIGPHNPPAAAPSRNNSDAVVGGSGFARPPRTALSFRNGPRPSTRAPPSFVSKAPGARAWRSLATTPSLPDGTRSHASSLQRRHATPMTSPRRPTSAIRPWPSPPEPSRTLRPFPCTPTHWPSPPLMSQVQRRLPPRRSAHGKHGSQGSASIPPNGCNASRRRTAARQANASTRQGPWPMTRPPRRQAPPAARSSIRTPRTPMDGPSASP